MIKVTRFFYINILVIPLFVAAYFAGALSALALSYSVVLVHELFHLFAALFLNVRVKSIIMMPFGMTLRLAEGVIKSPPKEALIAFCGPLANFLMMALGILLYVFYEKSVNLLFFIFLNALIGAINLLPAMPLDGGRVIRAVLTEKIGFLGAVSIMKKLTRITAVFVIIVGVVVLWISKMNMSLIIIGGFILLSMISDGKNNEFIIMKELLYSKDKLSGGNILKTRLISVGEEVSLGELIKKFDYSVFHLIGLVASDKSLKKIMTECEVIDAVVKKSTLCKMRDV